MQPALVRQPLDFLLIPIAVLCEAKLAMKSESKFAAPEVIS